MLITGPCYKQLLKQLNVMSFTELLYLQFFIAFLGTEAFIT